MAEIESPKGLAEKEQDKRKQLIEDMYGYTEDMNDEEKDEFAELVKGYVQHRKEKQAKPLKSILGR